MTHASASPQILVVCTGNVCRSPYIERRLQTGLDASWGPGQVVVGSAGTGALVGAPIDAFSLDRLHGVGGDGSDFVARELGRPLIAEAALVITATRDHRTLVTRMHPRALKTTHALRDLAMLAAGVQLPPPPDDVTARAWFDLVVPRLAAQRGVNPPLPDTEADVVDPFRREPEVFDLMAAQIEDALPPILRVLGRPDRS